MATISISDLLRLAVRGVQQSVSAVFIYWAVTLPVATLIAASLWWWRSDAPVDVIDSNTLLFAFITNIVKVSASAVAASLAFSNIGREIDKPIWKGPRGIDAIRRFGPIWFVLYMIPLLVHLLFLVIAMWSGETGYAAQGMLFFLILAGFIIPVGACFVFTGGFVRSEIAELLKPLGRNLSATLLLILFSIFAFGFLSFLQTPKGPLSIPFYVAITAIDGYVECLIFAAFWELCRFDRDHPASEDDGWDV